MIFYRSVPLGAFGVISYVFYSAIGWTGELGFLPLLIPGMFGSIGTEAAPVASLEKAGKMVEDNGTVHIMDTVAGAKGLPTKTGTVTVTGGNSLTDESHVLFYVEVAAILPQNLNEAVTVTVGGLTVSYSPMNYIVRMNAKGSESLQALLKAMYNYHLTAKAY